MSGDKKRLYVSMPLAGQVAVVDTVTWMVGDGVYEVSFVPPQVGVYYVFFRSPSLGVQFNQLPSLTLQATKP